LYYNLGNVLRDQGRLSEAVSKYQTAIELDSHRATPHVVLGLALREQGKLREAVGEYRKAIELQPCTSRHRSGRRFLSQKMQAVNRRQSVPANGEFVERLLDPFVGLLLAF
jgi:tetratricopeptide (TPR) repeat protein